MSKYVCVQLDGNVLYTATMANDKNMPLKNADGSVLIKVEQELDDNYLVGCYYDFESKLFDVKPPKPDDKTNEEFYFFNGATKTWALNLDLLIASILEERKNKLYLSDWTQLPDSSADKVAWAQYRQELRDITNQLDYPTVIIWPINPLGE